MTTVPFYLKVNDSERQLNFRVNWTLIKVILRFAGKYIYLESTDRKEGEAAVLTSSVIAAGKATCVQFWYHMKGQDIGSLNVFIQTNESRSLVWSQAGDKGANWLFGQVGYKGGSKSYKVWFSIVYSIVPKTIAHVQSTENKAFCWLFRIFLAVNSTPHVRFSFYALP